MISIGLLAAPAEATDWTASTSLSLKASDTQVKQGTKVTFTIKLKSHRKPCYQKEPVKWFRNGVYKRTLHTNNKGVINQVLQALGIIDAPLPLLYNDFAVYLGIVYSYLPFMILPLYANLERLDADLLDVASDLGARRWQVFLDVTLPLSRAGIIAGCLLVFIPAVGEFTIPALLGGADTLMIGRVLWDEFFSSRDWPVASAVSIVLLLLLVVPIMWFQHLQSREQEAGA